jgi:uncharacterized membrane protein
MSENKFYRYFLLLCQYFFISSLFILPILHYYNLSTNIADFGFFISNISNVSYEWQRSFNAHIQPIMLLFGYIYKYVPEDLFPYLLILFQSFIIFVSFLLIKKNYGALVSIAFILFSPIWAINLFDFHFDCIVILLLTLFFISVKNKKYTSSFLFSVSLIFIKEPYALQSAFCALYILYNLLLEKKRSPQLLLWAFIISLFSIASFIFQVNYLLPFFSGDPTHYSAFNAYQWLGDNLQDIFLNITKNMFYVLESIISNHEKMKFLTHIFGLLIFIPLLSPRPLIVAFPIFAISLLSNLENYYDYANHYTSGLIVPLIISFSDGINIINKKILGFYKFNRLYIQIYLQYGKASLLIILICLHFIFSFSPFSRFFISEKIYRYSYLSYIPDHRNKIIKSAIEILIPKNTNLIISSSNGFNYYAISNKSTILPFPMGVIKPFKLTNYKDISWTEFFESMANKSKARQSDFKFVYADFVILDEKRPIFLGDRGCNTVFSICLNNEVEKKYYEAKSALGSLYTPLYHFDDFYIYQKKSN